MALHRGEELKKLKERLSAAKLIMDKDPSAKPWMLSRFRCLFWMMKIVPMISKYNGSLRMDGIGRK